MLPGLSAKSSFHQRALETRIRQRISAFVTVVPGVPFHPMPRNFVARSLRIESFPQLAIAHRLFRSSQPAATLPAAQPLCNSVFDIRGISMQLDPTAFPERFKGANSRRQLHPIVRRLCLAAAQLPLDFTELQQYTPATGTGITTAGAISMDNDVFQGSLLRGALFVVGSTRPLTTRRRCGRHN